MTTATNKPKPTVADLLAAYGACSEALKWASGYTSPAKAWKECQRGDWMLWIIGKLSGPPESDGRKKLVLCAVECARTALPIFEKHRPNDRRVRACLEVTERWARGKATIDELRKAASAAYAAANAAYAAANAAYAAAYAAYAAAYAAYAAAYAAYAAADAARSETFAECADIVRKHYPRPPKGATR